MLNSDSPSVAFESATTLVTLSSAPSAVKAATNTLLGLMASQTDNNVKIVILERLAVIVRHNCRLLEDCVMELLALLRTPSTEIRRTLLELGSLLVTERNVGEVIALLKNEVVRCADDDDALNKEYREMLIATIHALALKYPAMADSVILLLLDYLNSESGASVLALVKEMLFSHKDLVAPVLQKLVDVLPSLEDEEVVMTTLWIFAAFTPDDLVPAAVDAILVPSVASPYA